MAAYREAMASFAAMGTLEIWYAHLAEDEFLKAIGSAAAEAKKVSKKAAKAAKRARRTSARVPPRRAPATACRRCPSSASWSTASTGS